jgi:hypothetical protein
LLLSSSRLRKRRDKNDTRNKKRRLRTGGNDVFLNGSGAMPDKLADHHSIP